MCDYKELDIYINLYSDTSRKKDKNGLNYLLKKDIVQGFPNNFMNDKLRKAIEEDEVEYTTTSGTTSDRMQIVRRKHWWKKEYKRTYESNELLKKCVEEHLPKAILTTAVCSNSVCYLETPSYEERIINGTLYLNLQHNPWAWNKEDILRIMHELKKFKTFYLDVDPIYFYIFLSKKKQFKIDEELYMPEIITISYEYAPQNIVEYIKENVSCKVVNLYGATEYGYIFIENDNNKMKVCPELIDLSFRKIENSRQLYELIITSYKNEFMPLVNYLSGDIVEMTDEEYMHFKEDGVISRIAGRVKTSINKENYIALCYIDDIINKNKEISIYQLYEIDNETFVLNYMTQDGNKLSSEIENGIKNMLSDLLRSKVEMKVVSTIMPEMSGKFSLIKLL